MAELHDIMGAILRDLAQARVTSDLYSREISKHYEKDSLLRLFPIPRTEINDVEIELKFAISEVDLDENRTNSRNAFIDRTIESNSEKISDEIFLDLKNSNAVADITEWQATIVKFQTTHLDTIKQLILNYLSEIIETLQNKEIISIDITKVREKINQILFDQIYSQESIVLLDEKYDCLVQVKSAVSRGLKSALEVLNEDLTFVTDSDEYKIEISVTKADLDALPPEAISSIKIRSSIRNYTWSQAEDSDGKVVRRLTPE